MLLRGVIILATPNEICKKEKASEKTLIKKYYLFTFPNFQITQTNVGSLVILLMVMIILSNLTSGAISIKNCAFALLVYFYYLLY